MRRQAPVPSPSVSVGNEGWGASDPEELVEHLEQIYTDRATAQARGHKGAEFIQGMSWSHQVDQLLDIIAEVR